MFIISGKQKLDDVTLLLTIEEAKQLYGQLEELLADKNMHHAHVSSDDYMTEINISIIEHNDISTYHEDIRKIIRGTK